MEPIEIRLFGEPSCAVGGVAWPLRGLRRAYELLALCALSAGKPLTREAAAAQLWPDLEREDARANLRRHLSRLRDMLPPDTNAFNGGDNRTLQWNEASPAWVDVIEFERLAADPQRAHAAMTLYRGDLLAPVCEDWVLAHRERLRTAAVTISHRLASNALHADDYASACEYAQRALELGEWREDSLRILMTARYALGDRLGALAAYDRFAETLHRDVGVKPMPETVSLRESIVADIPLSNALPEPPPVARAETRPLIGRDVELAQLRDEWERAKRRAGNAIFIGGEAGIGKTRLTSAVASIVETDGGSALFGYTSPDGTSAYQSIVDVVKAVLPLAIGQLDDDWLAPLVDLIPEIVRLRPSLDAVDCPLQRSRERLHQAFARAIEAAASIRPLLIVLEDLHWAGSDTLEAVAYLVRRLRGTRTLMLLTHRSEETPLSHPLRTTRRRLLTERRATMLPLVPLDAQAVHDLAAHLLPHEGDCAGIAQQTISATGGNPLFVLQYFRDRLEGGGDEHASGGVEAIIDSRLARLPSEARTLFTIAALIDTRFSIEELAEVSGYDEAAAHREIDVLLDRNYVRWFSEPGFMLMFTHQLLREGALRLAPANRESMHRRIARTLQSTRPQDLATQLLVARHYESAREHAEAYARYLQLATPSVAPVFAVDVAHAALRVASGERERFEALKIATQAHAVIGAGTDDYERDMRAFIDISRELGDREHFAALLVESDYSSREGNIVRMREVGDALLALAQCTGNREHLSRAYEERGRCLIQVGDVREGTREYQNAISFSEAGTLDEFRMRCHLLNAIARLGETDRAVELFKELEEEIERLDDPRAHLALGMAQQILAIVLEATDVFEAAGARLLAAAERVGAIGQRVVALSLLAQGAYRRLDIERARALRDEVYRAIDEHDIMINSVAVRNNLTLAEREIGNIDYAVREWERAYQIADGLRATSAMICSLVNRAEVFVENGKPLEGIALARRVVEMVRKSGERRFMIDAEMVLAQGFFATGRRAEALQIMKRVAVEREETKSLRSLSNDLCILIESLVSANRTADLPPYVVQLRELYALGRERVTYPTRVCAALSGACNALDDAPGSRRYRFEGKTILDQMLEKLPDDGTRAGFAAMSFNRYLMEPTAQKAAVGLNNR